MLHSDTLAGAVASSSLHQLADALPCTVIGHVVEFHLHMAGRQAASDRPHRKRYHSVTQLDSETLVLHCSQGGLTGGRGVMDEEPERSERGPVTPAGGGGKRIQ
jgi:hypothetical protein